MGSFRRRHRDVRFGTAVIFRECSPPQTDDRSLLHDLMICCGSVRADAFPGRSHLVRSSCKCCSLYLSYCRRVPPRLVCRGVGRGGGAITICMLYGGHVFWIGRVRNRPFAQHRLRTAGWDLQYVRRSTYSGRIDRHTSRATYGRNEVSHLGKQLSEQPRHPSVPQALTGPGGVRVCKTCALSLLGTAVRTCARTRCL